jgi:hypothetical protein
MTIVNARACINMRDASIKFWLFIHFNIRKEEGP